MIIFKDTIPELYDLHCHIIPYVDDGAEDLEEAKNLIVEEYSQGVRIIVMTVHLRKGMFDTSVEKIKRYFGEIQNWLLETDMSDLNIYMSREYYCDDRLEALLDAYIREVDSVIFDDTSYSPKEEIVPFGNKKCILLEFSSNKYQKDEFERFIKKALQAGFTPIIAHTERYPAVQNDPKLALEMKKEGAFVQVNCDSLLDKDSKVICDTAKNLMKSNLVDIICSDTHNQNERSTKLKKCYSFVKKKYGSETAKLLFHDNAEYLMK